MWCELCILSKEVGYEGSVVPCADVNAVLINNHPANFLVPDVTRVEDCNVPFNMSQDSSFVCGAVDQSETCKVDRTVPFVQFV
ncbi:hypothetical protein [uncultured Methanobrevibacter sp.]|uniref:hypothetical protein n=1 Tax=uncultured Methanobrevibacter sp. TaxID=253161 RepID=UPI0025F4A8A8|nr:hypothetical protein [uncultured Methanobrevibacter sp.]